MKGNKPNKSQAAVVPWFVLVEGKEHLLEWSRRVVFPCFSVGDSLFADNVEFAVRSTFKVYEQGRISTSALIHLSAWTQRKSEKTLPSKGMDPAARARKIFSALSLTSLIEKPTLHESS